VVEQTSGQPGVYACGHQDRMADLKASQLQAVQAHLDATLVGMVSSASGYPDTATADADPARFMADLRRAMELATQADYPSLIPAPDYAGWLKHDRQAELRAAMAKLRVQARFGDATSLNDDPPILFRITDV
jgi:hypothetical protein